MDIVIVGNGRSLQDGGLGPQIDAALVARTFNCDWQLSSPAADYGRRYDIGILTGRAVRGDFWRHPRPARLTLSYVKDSQEWEVDRMHRERDATFLFSHAATRLWQQKLRARSAVANAVLTRGMAAIIMLAAQREMLGTRRILLAGFDEVLAGRKAATIGERYPETYIARMGFRQHRRTHPFDHDYAVERVLLPEIAEQYGVTIAPLVRPADEAAA